MNKRLTPLFLVVLIVLTFGPGCERGDEDYASTEEDAFDTPVDETIVHPGLFEEVDVLFDSYGIPHVYTRNDHDIWFMQGYLASLDRFSQMDLARHLGTGRLGEILGQVPLVGDVLSAVVVEKVDLFYRAIFTGTDGVPVVDHILAGLDEETAQTLQTYADGVNAYLYDVIMGRYGITRPPVYSGLIQLDPSLIEPWTVRDTLSILLVSLWSASNSVDYELKMGEALAGLGADKFNDFYRSAPDDGTTVLPVAKGDKGDQALPDLQSLRELEAELTDALPAIRAALDSFSNAGTNMAQQGMHSNNWVVDAEHSATGNALIANDPHLGLLNPAYFWLSHLDSTTFGDGSLHIAGLGFPGAPGIQIGHNQHVGWAGTAANYDTVDGYIESLNPDNENEVLFEGRAIPIQRIEQEFLLSLDPEAGKISHDVQVVPHHGPILPGSCISNRCVSVKWTGATAGTEIQAFLDVLTARNVDEALDAFSQYQRGPYNWVVADTEGRVGYIAAAELPLRENWETTPPYLPLSGSSGQSEWVGRVPPDVLARYDDPANGIIVTANNDIYDSVTDNNPANNAYYYYWYVDIGYRAGRITNLLLGGDGVIDPDNLTLNDLAKIQTDNLSLAAMRLVPHLLTASTRRPDLVDDAMASAIGFLRGWDYTTPAGLADKYRTTTPSEYDRNNSVATTLFHVWFARAAQLVFGDDFRKAGVELPGEGSESGPQMETRAMVNLLQREPDTQFGNKWWDDQETLEFETRDEMLLAALRAAITTLHERLGSAMGEWYWGKLHTAEFGLTFEGFTVPSLITPILGPAVSDGGNFTVNVANTYGLEEDFYNSHAPAARILMEIDGDRFETRAVLPGGQSERFDSMHYQDMFLKYLSGEYVSVPFQFKDVQKIATQRIRFIPSL